MRKLILIFTLLFLIPIICLSNGYADNMLRCPGGIISLGDTKEDLMDKCGNPTDVEKSWLNVEYLTYDRGPNRLVKTIKIIDGIVNRIKSDGYGEKPGK